ILSATGNILLKGQGGPGTGTTSDVQSNVGLSISGAQVTSTGTATITLDATGGGGQSFNDGLVMATNAKISSAQGNITVRGQGGAGINSRGVYLSFGAVVESTGTAQITLNGTGGPVTQDDHGIAMDVVGTSVTSINGDILLNGDGGGKATATGGSFGIYMTNGVKVASTGAAKITLDGAGGQGGSANHGVVIQGANALVSSSGSGNVQLLGTAGTDTAPGSFGFRFEGGTINTSASTGKTEIDSDSIFFATTGSTL